MKKHQGWLLFSITAIFASMTYAHPTIDLNKIKPADLHAGPYSFMVPPYSYYYYHNIDKLGFHLDWIKRAGPVYPLIDSHKTFTANYTYHHHTYTLNQYYKRNAVLGFLILKNNQIISERYFHGATENSRFISSVIRNATKKSLMQKTKR